MNEENSKSKIKIFFVGLLSGGIAFLSLLFSKHLRNNRSGTSGTRNEQSEDTRRNERLENDFERSTERIESVESVTDRNKEIFAKIRERKKNN